MEDPIFVIANPAAGGGRGAKVLAELERLTAPLPHVVVRVTRGPGDEARLTQRALAHGARAIVAVGGDGTWSKVAGALLESERRPPLALVAGGTGNDFAKSVGAPARDVARTLELVAARMTRRVDVGMVDGKFFLVCCGFGFDTAVLRRMQSVPGLRGSARYVYAALRELSSFNGFDVSFEGDLADGTAAPGIRRLLMLVIANAQHYGGAFKIAPEASLTDGLLHAIAVAPLNTLRRAGLLLSATRGAHVLSPGVREYKARLFELRFPAPPLYNLDGDLYQARSRTLRVEGRRGALEVVAPRD